MRAELFLVIIVTLFLACSEQQSQTDVDITAPVSVEEVKYKPIEEFLTTTGTVSATKVYDLYSEQAGYYRLGTNPRTSRPFAIGDQVKKDEILVYLDNPEVENTIKIDSQKLSLDLAQREYEKQQSLYEKGGVTLHDLTTAQKSFIDAKYSYENSLIQLSRMKVNIPFDGVIVDMTYYTKGIKVESGKEIASIMNYSKLNMDVSLPAKEMGRIKENQPARITNYTLPDKIMAGKIMQVSPALDPTTRTFKATLDIDIPGLLLKPGMFVKVDIIVAHKDSAIVITKDIITTRRQDKRIFVVDKGLASERPITIGLENPTQVEVLTGLNVGDRLVVKGFETLQDHGKVKITK
ncbi:MAG: efflux RND transporter periplasmic adaptor subunit [Candidatus Latescibacterota bacterium]